MLIRALLRLGPLLSPLRTGQDDNSGSGAAKCGGRHVSIKDESTTRLLSVIRFRAAVVKRRAQRTEDIRGKAPPSCIAYGISTVSALVGDLRIGNDH